MPAQIRKLTAEQGQQWGMPFRCLENTEKSADDRARAMNPAPDSYIGRRERLWR